MIVVSVDFVVAPENVKAAMARLQRDRDAVRAMDGNLAFDVFVEPSEVQTIRNWHEWQSLEHLSAYTASDIFKQFGLALRHMMLAPPVSRRMEAQLLDPVA